MESKREIRKRILRIRNELTMVQRSHSEALMINKILSHEWYCDAKKILLYYGYGSEMDTKQLINASFQQKKEVYLPKVHNDTMSFIRIYSDEILKEGYKGILEPDDKTDKDIFSFKDHNPDEVLMIMPGVAFDKNRNRIGYGKGFYDRYLSDKDKLRTIAICFNCQMIDLIDADENDIKPKQIIYC